MKKTENGSQHITPANGNVFLDLGFEPEEAARLLAETDKEIMAKRASAVLQRPESTSPDDQPDA
ncbi:hypothetical protein [Sideroxydans sp.]